MTEWSDVINKTTAFKAQVQEEEMNHEVDTTAKISGTLKYRPKL
jgi:hypothetical protein